MSNISTDNIYHAVNGPASFYGPEAERLEDAITNIKTRLAITCRTKLYTGVVDISDINNDSIGNNLCILMRLMCRYLLMENPARLSQMNELKEALIDMWSELGFQDYILFLTWFLKGRVGNISMLAALFRTYSSASDVAARNFFTELKTPSMAYFARFISVSCINMNMDKVAMNTFKIVKDIFFECIRMTPEQYKGESNMVEPVVPLYYGIMHNFFSSMKDLEGDTSSR